MWGSCEGVLGTEPSKRNPDRKQEGVLHQSASGQELGLAITISGSEAIELGYFVGEVH